MWRYATAGRRLVDPDLSPHVMRYMYVRAGTATSIYLLAIALAYVAPGLVVFFTPVFRRILAWLERRRRGKDGR
jgi:hypothetical protein